MRVLVCGVERASSIATEVVEGNHYFPLGSIKEGVLKRNETSYTCPWKGVATYWNLDVDGQQVTDGGWSYDTPSGAAMNIKAFVVFDRSQVDIEES